MKFLIVIAVIVFVASAKAASFMKWTRLAPDYRIVGGVETTIEEHPYQISLEHYERHICGGSLISQRAVLTAAHCVANYDIFPFTFTVRVGSTKVNSGGKTVLVKQIIAHPDYHPYNSNDYDVAVIILHDAIPFSASVQTIPLAAEEVKIGTSSVVTGWGSLYSQGPLPVKLYEVFVPTISRETCQDRYPEEKISERMICAGFEAGGKDSCQGDSGGPLVADGKQIGVVSWGYGCALKNRPGVYANVAELRSWIYEKAGMN